jgi:dihydrofolate synthase/folylpolyglutamate synthase
MSTDQILKRLLTLHPKVIDLSLERIERLLAALGNPERQLPPVVHIAGTNGKGSTVAFLRAFCEAAGLRAHVYTSPHLVKFNERIRVAGQLISDDALNAVLEECERVNAGQPITFFEITTAAAFLAFARSPADIVILETGLGGRLDATNVITAPRLTCITPVSLDHQHYLGDDVDTIMGEKAGILKPGVPCIAAQQGSRKLEKTLADAAKKVGAPLLAEGKRWFSRVSGGRRGEPKMVFKGETIERTFPMPRLVGRHQLRNAALAIACVDALAPDLVISDAAIALGLSTVEWPGRLQQLKNGPLVDALQDGWELWLDGGHNRGAAEVLAQHTRGWREQDLWMVFGALKQRDPLDFLKPFEAKLAGFRGVAIPGEETTLSAAEVAGAASVLQIPAQPADSVLDAVRDIMKVAGLQGGRILICGSLYLVGTVLQDNA